MVLHSHGWGGSRSTCGFDDWLDHGFVVLSFDPRGFGESGGQASVQDPQLEARDVQVLIDEVVLAREISWFDLRDSLAPSGVVRRAWVVLLYAAVVGGQLLPIRELVPVVGEERTDIELPAIAVEVPADDDDGRPGRGRPDHAGGPGGRGGAGTTVRVAWWHGQVPEFA